MVRFISKVNMLWKIGALLLSILPPLLHGYDLQEQGRLSKSKDSILASGGFFKEAEAVHGWTMPLLRIYKVIDASPEEAAAVYFDVDKHPKYFPDIISVKVDSAVSPSQLFLKFDQHVVLWLHDKSRVENIFGLKDSVYFLRWRILHSEGAENGEGLISFQDFHGKTLMRYAALVQPRSILMKIPFIRNKAIGRICDILHQTERAIKAEKLHDPDLLQKQIGMMKIRTNQD
jgi:hypothetical protein